MHKMLAMIIWALTAAAATAAQTFSFASVDGGMLRFSDWKGQPVLVVNTASRCGYTHQYNGLQALHDRFSKQGLVVLAVPSNDFRQELASAKDVQAFCEVNFDLTLPMTDITTVTGPDAHAFYKWVRQETGFAPTWNFNKVLIAPDGSVAGTFGSKTRPQSRTMLNAIRAVLDRAY